MIGTTAAVLGAGAGIAGVIGARQGAKSANAANDAMANYYNWLANVGQQQWGIYLNNVVPQLKQLSAQTPLNPELLAGQAADTARGQYDVGKANLERALSTTRSPADPGYSAALAAYQQGEAPAVSQAITASRNTTNELNYERALQTAGAWMGLPQGTNSVGTAAAGFGNVAKTNLAITGMQNQSAGQAAYGGVALAGAIRRMGTPGGPTGPQPAYGAPSESYFGNTNAAGGFSGGGAGPNTDWTGTNWNYRDGGAIHAPAFSSVSEYNPSQQFKEGGAIQGPASGAGEYAPVAMFAQGGKVKGPGTGTSDSISAIKKPGTFIVPADVVKAKGEAYFDKMLEKHGIRPGNAADDPSGTPVRLSNGEYSIPPHIVRREGTELFNSMLQKFHHPVEGEQVGMANGGAIRKRGLPSNVEDAIYRAMPTHILSRQRWAH